MESPILRSKQQTTKKLTTATNICMLIINLKFDSWIILRINHNIDILCSWQATDRQTDRHKSGINPLISQESEETHFPKWQTIPLRLRLQYFLS